MQSWPPIINPNIYLPLNFTECLLDALNEDFNYRMVPALMSCLKNSDNFPIRRINLMLIKTLTNEDLQQILTGNNVSRLSVNSSQLTNQSIQLINNKAANITHLGLGKKCFNIFQRSSRSRRGLNYAEKKLISPLLHHSSSPTRTSSLSPPQSSSSPPQLSSSPPQSSTSPEPIFTLPNLQILSINVKHPDVSSVFDFFDLMSFSHKLSVLDLSDCSSHIRFESFLSFKQLKYLSLHNIILSNFGDTLSVIQQLTTLRSLDIGMSYRDEPYSYDGDITSMMTHLLDHLPHLNSLEICGTNLAGIKAIQPVSMRMKMMFETAGIEWLVGRKLDYLGLLNCIDQPCIRHHIYAHIVSGDDTIEQILVSLESYFSRNRLFLLSLNRLFEVIRNDNLPVQLQANALQSILKGMKKYFEDNSIQISGSASMFYLVKGNLKEHLTPAIKRRMIKVLLDAMESFTLDINMARNGCLTLCHFKFPSDLLHDYTRVVKVLLSIVSKIELTSDFFVHRVALNLLNSLACQVDNPEKVILGQLPTFEIILDLVVKRVEAGKCDELMEVAWSLMWNATDETAPNCQKFIEHGGLRIFTQCLTVFPESEELLRNMMGLLGNVAEVFELRRLLMKEQLMDIFTQLLDSRLDGIEVSYNACGVLANLLSDGQEAWLLEERHRTSVVQKMQKAIKLWPVHSERNINYRSFKPILRLLQCQHTPVVQYWATWALCNLTKVYRNKYCPLLKSEEGVDKLTDLFIATEDNHIKQLTGKIIRRCNRYFLNPRGDSESDDGEEGGGDYSRTHVPMETNHDESRGDGLR